MRVEFVEELLQTPQRAAGRWYWITLAAAATGVLGGVCAWGYQIGFGLGVTGLNQPVYWGLYITNFVFFIGISHAGTLISAILRLSGAEWRRPVTRIAEAITVFALILGGAMIVCDMGRPDRILNVLWYGRIQSPLLWDVLSVSSYLFASVIYLYVPLIPDIAMIRDRMTGHGFMSRFYRLLALNWQGTPMQQKRLERAIRAGAIMIVPLAVSVHTVVSYVFAMTLRPMWHSTIFGPYFVIGAIYSGIAALLIAMVIIRKALRLEAYLKEVHFRNLAYLLLVMFGLWLYATVGEYLVTGYGGAAAEARVLLSKVQEHYAWPFWGMLFAMLGAFLILAPVDRVVKALRLPIWKTRPLPAFLLASLGWCIWFSLARAGGFAKTPRLLLALTEYNQESLIAMLPSFLFGLVYLAALLLVILPSLRRDWFTISLYASLLVIVGMWLERFTIVVPTLTLPMLEEVPWGQYVPTWVELAITGSAVSAMLLFYLLFARFFPLVSAWEVAEGIERIDEARERLLQYVPEGVTKFTATHPGGPP